MKKTLLLLSILVLPFFNSYAQGNSSFGRDRAAELGRGRDTAAPEPPPAVPVDGGLLALLAAGGLYGFKKLRDFAKE